MSTFRPRPPMSLDCHPCASSTLICWAAMRLRSRNPWPAVPCAPYGSQVTQVKGSADALSRFSVPLFPNTLFPDSPHGPRHRA
jgi:hypothetical protein